ncbi:MAG: (d)CMP kinase [Gammaproteobacteria bacterium]|nr:(d)CMP kinase [Gammaproteobacteria bacterium]
MRSVPVVAVDGPVGVGKGTLCAALARTLGWNVLDSGAIYRLLGLAALRAGVAFDDHVGLAALAQAFAMDFAFEPRQGLVAALLDGQDVSAQIRTEQAGRNASLVASIPTVRDALLQRQRDFRSPPGLIADGRDMGTVVFPDAQIKIFLTATAQERARRRRKQLRDKGIDANLAALSAEINARDKRDSERAAAPLRAAPDASEIDTSDASADEVFAWVFAIIHAGGFG